MQLATSFKGLASRLVPVVAVLGLAVTAASATVDAQDRRDFDVVNGNRTSPITRLNVSSSARTEWGPNILRGAIAPGGRTHVFFPRAGADCLYDIRASYPDGRTADMRRVNLCRTTTVTIR